MTPMTLAVTFDDVRAAAGRLAGHAHRTPVLRSRSADARTGAELFFKAEHLQRMGAFKFRGAFNAIARLTDDERKRGVLAFSSGNHAQAIALSAREQGTRATIVMPADAPPVKLAATRGYGAEVITYDRFNEDREAIARRLAGERGLALIPPFDHADVIAGQGTAALELLEETGPLDVLLVCVGGGGLISGCATAAKGLAPACRVIGVEPAAGNDVQQSLAAGRPVTIGVPRTIADGAQTTRVGDLTFPIIRDKVEAVVTVTDEQLVDTMRFFAERMKQVVEPTGCLAAAAALEKIVDLRGTRAGVIVSGGNVDPASFARLIAGVRD
ncbi:MAG TPA: threo-3-hydroxy-L-aspartate ammonia-lyase [Burkholderiaceae bacterium]|nr:threo-3-hydroxy-L-aspartate ammonia-lyase [Burkholderiaceae bacterium]